MKQLTDEILNKYIDNELTTHELDEFKKLIASDGEALRLLKAHKLADHILHKMEVAAAPTNFTDKVMDKIFSTVPQRLRKSYFVPVVIGFLFTAIIGVTAYALSAIPADQKDSSNSMSIITDAKNIVAEKVGTFSSFFNNDTILIVGSFLTFILLLSAYFMINSHKNFKHDLDKFSH